MKELKLLPDWEKETGMMIRGDINEKQTLTKDDFLMLASDGGGVGVDFDFRTKFLTANGYELTRENYMDSNLSSRRGYVEQMARKTEGARRG